MLASPLPGQLWANMTSSTKPEVHNVSHCRQRKIEPWRQLTLQNNFVELGRAVRATLARVGISCHRASVRLSIRLSQVRVLLKRLNAGSRKQCYMIAKDSFSDAENLNETQTKYPPTKAPNAGGVR